MPEAANEQHYELPAEFLGLFLGPRRKYRAACGRRRRDDLAAAEEAMLALTCERAGIEDGMRILDLGCGWGSLSLWLAERYPGARIVASRTRTASVRGSRPRRPPRASRTSRSSPPTSTTSRPTRRFDRVVSVEMFEHMRNWDELLRRIVELAGARTGARSSTSSATGGSPTASRGPGRPSASSPPA